MGRGRAKTASAWAYAMSRCPSDDYREMVRNDALRWLEGEPRAIFHQTHHRMTVEDAKMWRGIARGLDKLAARARSRALEWARFHPVIGQIAAKASDAASAAAVQHFDCIGAWSALENARRAAHAESRSEGRVKSDANGWDASEPARALTILLLDRFGCSAGDIADAMLDLARATGKIDGIVEWAKKKDGAIAWRDDGLEADAGRERMVLAIRQQLSRMEREDGVTGRV